MTWGPTKKLYNIAQSEYKSVCVNLGAEMLSQEASEGDTLIQWNLSVTTTCVKILLSVIFFQYCVLMKTEGINLLLLAISALWSSSRWPLATKMSSRRQRSIPLGGRYRQVSLYRQTCNIRRTLIGDYILDHSDLVGASPVGAAPCTSSFST